MTRPSAPAIADPVIAPSTPPAPMRPNTRFASAISDKRSMADQKLGTTSVMMKPVQT
jgi:hypothetical protein